MPKTMIVRNPFVHIAVAFLFFAAAEATSLSLDRHRHVTGAASILLDCLIWGLFGAALGATKMLSQPRLATMRRPIATLAIFGIYFLTGWETKGEAGAVSFAIAGSCIFFMNQWILPKDTESQMTQLDLNRPHRDCD